MEIDARYDHEQFVDQAIRDLHAATIIVLMGRENG